MCHSQTVSVFLLAVLRPLRPVRKLCDWERERLWLSRHLGRSFYDREVSRVVSGDSLGSGSSSVWQRGFRGFA